MAAIIERLVGAVNAHDVELLVACFAPAGRVEIPAADLTCVGPVQVREAAGELFRAFEDLSWRSRARWLDENGSVEEGTWTGTHTGWTAAAAPTGTRVTIRARLLIEHGDTAIRRLRIYMDLTGLRLALGLPVSSAAAAADTSQFAPLADAGRTRVFVRPDDPVDPAPRPRRRRAGPRPLAVLVGVLLLIGVTVAALMALTSPTPGTSTATTTTPGAASARGDQAAASKTAAPSPARTAKARSGVTQRGRNLDLSTDLLFPPGSAVLTVRSLAAINEVAAVLRERRVTGRVKVNGYTDDVGSAAYNLDLSRRRAQAVAVALRAKITGGSLTLQARGLGEADPVASNSTEPGRTRNRRVTIVLPKPQP